MKKHKLTINPELARKILANRQENKDLQQEIIDEYSTIMKNGEWGAKDGIIILSERSVEEPLTPSIIESSEDLKLHDGHHRLNAIIKSETEHDFEVLTIEDSDWESALGLYVNQFPMTTINASITHFRLSDLEEIDLGKFLEKNPELNLSAVWARKRKRFFETEQKRSLLRKRFLLAFLHFKLSGENLENSDLAEEFLKKLIGEDLDVEDEIIELREISLQNENDDYIERLNQIITGAQIWMSLKQQI